MTITPDYFKDVHGFITFPEAELLNRLAAQVPRGGKIVEIGGYQARSTIALALGALEGGAMVWSIDPHPDYEQGGTVFGMRDNLAYYGNIADYGVGQVVKTINLTSDETFIIWKDDIDLLWIDGNHEYDQVHKDWYLWSQYANLVALHDTAGHHVGVSRLVSDIVASGQWEQIEVVDAITVFKFVGVKNAASQ